MADNTQRSRPAETIHEAAQAFGGAESDSTENLTAMRRRREAALRSIPLATGMRDPQFDRFGGAA